MNHSCAASRVEHFASPEEPFHFTDSGLSYVYLVGIKYYTCECGRVTAEIPAIKELMQLIARDLLQKPASLTGEEIRFLRKRLGKKQADLAREIGIEPETLNRYENDKLAVSEMSDKLIRLYYVAFSKDEHLQSVRQVLEKQMSEWHVSREPRRIVKRVAENEWRDEAAA